MGINYKLYIRILGTILAVGGIAVIPSGIASVIFGETRAAAALFGSAAIMLAIGAPLFFFVKPGRISMKLKEGYIVVAFCWLCVCLAGTLPYLMSGYTHTFIDAFFESVAGFTTTGCTVLNVDHIPHGILMWQATTEWLGGMGILVLVISILPSLGVGGQSIVKAETSGPQLKKLSGRIADSTRILYLTYVLLSCVEFVLLLLGPMNTFDALVNTLGSISTGGLFTHLQGFGYYDSVYLETVISVFTLLSAVSFSLYVMIFQGKWRDAFKNLEMRVFFTIMLVISVLIALSLIASGTYDSPLQSLRYAFFQTIAFITTSGYAITDYTL
jgi:trk system potassium uptake protein TrkH